MILKYCKRNVAHTIRLFAAKRRGRIIIIYNTYLKKIEMEQKKSKKRSGAENLKLKKIRVMEKEASSCRKITDLFNVNASTSSASTTILPSMSQMNEEENLIEATLQKTSADVMDSIEPCDNVS